VYILKKSSVNENRTFGDKIRGKIGFLGGEKEMQGVGREIFNKTPKKNRWISNPKPNPLLFEEAHTFITKYTRCCF
jgi:hypothetical protein